MRTVEQTPTTVQILVVGRALLVLIIIVHGREVALNIIIFIYILLYIIETRKEALGSAVILCRNKHNDDAHNGELQVPSCATKGVH